MLIDNVDLSNQRQNNVVKIAHDVQQHPWRYLNAVAGAVLLIGLLISPSIILNLAVQTLKSKKVIDCIGARKCAIY